MNTWGEAMKAIGALEQRVSELEARVPAPEIKTRGLRTNPNCDARSHDWVISAARRLLEFSRPMGDSDRIIAWNELQQAVDNL